MKKIIYYFILIGIVIVVFIYKDEITSYITKDIIKQEEPDKITYNEYYSNQSFNYVKITNDFKIHKIEDINNIFYTILNSGDTKFSFYCDENYKRCIKDVKTFFNDKNILANINNFVHPYNSFSNIKVSISNYGKIEVEVIKVYDDAEIEFVNNEIDNFIKNNINDNQSINDKVKLFHDYIINNTKFDTSIENSTDKSDSDSYKAYGLLKNNLAICGGYSDTIAIYLNKLGIKNYRISTTEHVWNLVNIDNKWYHLDATWDDPVTSDNSDMLMYDYFLIDTNTLLEKDTTQHNFDKNVYNEAN